MNEDAIIRRLAARINHQTDMRLALQWYADFKNYAAPARRKAGAEKTIANIAVPIFKDRGRKARLALASIRKGRS